MRSISSTLLTAFKNGNRATIIKIVTKAGQVFGYTDFDTTLIVDGTTYVCAPGMTRPVLTASSDDQVSNQEFVSAWIDAPEDKLIAGLFDNALVEIAYCDPINPLSGRYVFDKGNIGIIQWTADGFRADMQSHMRNLARNLNFNFTGSCRHTLYGQFDNTHIGACTLNAASYTFSGSVASVAVPKIKFAISVLAQPAGMCTNGILTWTTGNNAGLKYEVKVHTATTIELFLPTFVNIVAGDNYTVTAGCNKTFATCKSKFSNAINFGGFPHIQSEVQYR